MPSPRHDVSVNVIISDDSDENDINRVSKAHSAKEAHVKLRKQQQQEEWRKQSYNSSANCPTVPKDSKKKKFTDKLISESNELTPEISTPKRKKMSNQGGHCTDKTVIAGYRLYSYHKKKMSNKTSHDNTTEGKKLKEALDMCTFNPELTRHTEELIDTKTYKPPHKRFGAVDEMKRDCKRLSMDQMKRVEQLDPECTFWPTVSPVSVVLSSRHPGRSQDASVRLYEENEQRQIILFEKQRAQEQMEKIGHKKVDIAHAAAYGNRLHEWGKKREVLLDLVREEMLHHYDSNIRATPKKVENLIERLTNRDTSCCHKHEKAENRSRSSSAQRNKPLENSYQLIGAASNELAERNRSARYKKIFKELTKGREVTFKDLKAEVGMSDHKFKGILDAFPSANNAENIITEEAFIQALEEFERKYGPRQWGRRDHQSPEHSHRPLITPRTNQIIEEKRRSSRESANIHVAERLYALGIQQQQLRRLQNHIVDQANRKLDDDCTFIPTISEKSKKLAMSRTSPMRRSSSLNKIVRASGMSSMNNQASHKLENRSHILSTRVTPRQPIEPSIHYDMPYTERDISVSPLSDATDNTPPKPVRAGANSPISKGKPISNTLGKSEDILREIDLALLNHAISSDLERTPSSGLRRSADTELHNSSANQSRTLDPSNRGAFESCSDKIVETVYRNIDNSVHKVHSVIVRRRYETSPDIILSKEDRDSKAF
eukprot:Tbor_TRINITY_DN5417_c3_g10::TRINITY_DN5417_c3_g10_i1::g.24995::m.24995